MYTEISIQQGTIFDEKPDQLMIVIPAIALESVLKAYQARNMMGAHKFLTSSQWSHCGTSSGTSLHK